MRHNNDVYKLREIVGEKYRSKIEYEKCATVWYVGKYWKDKFKNEDNLLSSPKAIFKFFSINHGGFQHG